MIERMYILCIIIIIKSEVWTITHCLGLGYDTMVAAVSFYILNNNDVYMRRYMYWKNLYFVTRTGTVKPVCNDHPYNKTCYLGFIQECV